MKQFSFTNPVHYLQLITVLIGLLIINPFKVSSQIAEFEGTVRSTSGLPEFQLFDNAGSENRLEGRLREIGDEIFLESYRGNLKFGASNSGTLITRMTINATNGNVGIGTASPVHKLHVKGGVSRLESTSSSAKYIETRTDGSVTDLLAAGAGLNIAVEGGNPLTLQGYGRTGRVLVRGDFGSAADFSVNGAAAVKDWFRVNGNTDGTAWRLGVNGQSIFRGMLRIAQLGGTQNDGISLSIPNSSSLWEIWHGGALRFAWANVERSFISTNGSYNVSSDKSKKKNIKPTSSQLTSLLHLNPVNYEYKYAESSKIELGFIAQEVQKLYPNAVNEASDGTLGVAYDYFAVLAIKGIQEQQDMINTLKTKNATLENQIEELMKRVNLLEQK